MILIKILKTDFIQSCFLNWQKNQILNLYNLILTKNLIKKQYIFKAKIKCLSVFILYFKVLENK